MNLVWSELSDRLGRDGKKMLTSGCYKMRIFNSARGNKKVGRPPQGRAADIMAKLKAMGDRLPQAEYMQKVIDPAMAAMAISVNKLLASPEEQRVAPSDMCGYDAREGGAIPSENWAINRSHHVFNAFVDAKFTEICGGGSPAGNPVIE